MKHTGKYTAMFAAILVAVAWILFMILACSSPRHVTKDNVIEVHDTTVVHDSVKILYTPKQVKVKIPESTQEKVTKDTFSLLRNKLSESRAYWDGSFLHHTLKTIPGASVSDTIYVPEITTIHDSTSNSQQKESKNNTVFIEKKLTTLQKFKLFSFWIFFVLSLPTIYWAFRKYLLKRFL